MVTMDEVRAAVDKAKEIMADCGIKVEVTADQLWDWFQTDLPVPDVELGEVVIDPLTVIHELVEIDEILKMGLAITKDVIIKNPEKVDDAHLRAAKVELEVAKAIRAVDHMRERILSIEGWCVDKTLSEDRKAEYRRLLAKTKADIAELTGPLAGR